MTPARTLRIAVLVAIGLFMAVSPIRYAYSQAPAPAGKASTAPSLTVGGTGGSTPGADHGYAAAAAGSALSRPLFHRSKRFAALRRKPRARSRRGFRSTLGARVAAGSISAPSGVGQAPSVPLTNPVQVVPPASAVEKSVGAGSQPKSSVPGASAPPTTGVPRQTSEPGQARKLQKSAGVANQAAVPHAAAVRVAPVAVNRAIKKPTSTGGSELTLTQTKPDLTPVAPAPAKDHTIESPMQAVGDGWKMVAYLLPTLALVVVCLNLLRRFQLKNGRLPSVLQKGATVRARPASSTASSSIASTLAGLVGSLRSARSDVGTSSSIRLLESLAVGTATLHLVEVRGKTLLLAGNSTGVTVLSEFGEEDGAESEDFRQALREAAADMDGLDLPEAQMPMSAVVGSLENAMRETGDSVERRLRLLRTLNEKRDGGL